MTDEVRVKTLREDECEQRATVVVGTRPGIIKMSPLIRELGQRSIPFSVIHTGQHYSPEMDNAFFQDLDLAPPDHHLDEVEHCYFHGEQTAAMIQGVEQALLRDRPRVVLVCGDANTNLAAGLAARKLRLVLGHVESGLRSGDWSMPEEHNRIILDHISELLFAPTDTACRNLENDFVRGEIHLTGNTIVDAVNQNLEIARRKSDALDRLAVPPNDFVICTCHREENVDSAERLEQILKGVSGVATQLNRQVIFPVHPRTRRRLSEFGFDADPGGGAAGVRLIDPVGYLDFLQLLANARLVLTDSGGIQEESCILQVPCVTLRDNTERPETITVGSNRIAGVEPERILAEALAADKAARSWANPFGDGRAAQRIIDVVERVLAQGVTLAQHDWDRVVPHRRTGSPEEP